MATTRNLGGVFMKDVDGRLSSTPLYVSTENVCGIIFDTKFMGGLDNSNRSTIFGNNANVQDNFKDGNVVELNNAEDVAKAGIDDKVMKGLVKYHLDMFFALAGDGQRLFVSFMDSTTDTTFSAVEKMQLAANGIIYQIGVWTGEPIGTKTTSGNTTSVTIATDNIIKKLQTQAEKLGGKIGTINYDGNAPVNIVLNAPIVADDALDLDILPDINTLECPKVSVVIGQAATDEVHEIQFAMKTSVTTGTGDDAQTVYHAYVPVGNIGATMACLAAAPAEESIAHVANFNLAPSITEAELGFGNLSLSGDDEFEDTASFNNIKAIKYADRNTKIHKKGFIFLRNYDGIENGIFLSSDQTLSNGDYRTISRGRVIHKSRRVVRLALLPYVNAPFEVESDTGTLTSSDVTMFTNLVSDALDTYMVEPAMPNVPQISGREVIIDETQNVLDSDALLIEYYLLPIGCTSAIYVTEGFTASVS